MTFLDYVREFDRFVKSHFQDTSILIGTEVGVWQGHHAMAIKEFLQPRLLLLVDAWHQSIGDSGWHPEGATHRGSMLITYDKFSQYTDIVIMRGLSAIVADVLKGCLDFVYVDAAHDYDSVASDIDKWYPLVKPGGVIGGHDYNFESVSKAVHDFFGEHNVSHGVVDWWVVK